MLLGVAGWRGDMDEVWRVVRVDWGVKAWLLRGRGGEGAQRAGP